MAIDIDGDCFLILSPQTSAVLGTVIFLDDIFGFDWFRILAVLSIVSTTLRNLKVQFVLEPQFNSSPQDRHSGADAPAQSSGFGAPIVEGSLFESSRPNGFATYTHSRGNVKVELSLESGRPTAVKLSRGYLSFEVTLNDKSAHVVAQTLSNQDLNGPEILKSIYDGIAQFDPQFKSAHPQMSYEPKNFKIEPNIFRGFSSAPLSFEEFMRGVEVRIETTAIGSEYLKIARYHDGETGSAIRLVEVSGLDPHFDPAERKIRTARYEVKGDDAEQVISNAIEHFYHKPARSPWEYLQRAHENMYQVHWGLAEKSQRSELSDQIRILASTRNEPAEVRSFLRDSAGMIESSTPRVTSISRHGVEVVVSARSNENVDVFCFNEKLGEAFRIRVPLQTPALNSLMRGSLEELGNSLRSADELLRATVLSHVLRQRGVEPTFYPLHSGPRLPYLELLEQAAVSIGCRVGSAFSVSHDSDTVDFIFRRSDDLMAGFQQTSLYRALPDIDMSSRDLRIYQDRLIVSQDRSGTGRMEISSSSGWGNISFPINALSGVDPLEVVKTFAISPMAVLSAFSGPKVAKDCHEWRKAFLASAEGQTVQWMYSALGHDRNALLRCVTPSQRVLDLVMDQSGQAYQAVLWQRAEISPLDAAFGTKATVRAFRFSIKTDLVPEQLVNHLVEFDLIEGSKLGYTRIYEYLRRQGGDPVVIDLPAHHQVGWYQG